MTGQATAPDRSRVRMDDRIRARRREVVRARVRRRRRMTVSVVALLALVAVAVAVSRSPLFAVDEVEVVGVSDDQAEAVRAAAAVRPGQRLLSIDLEHVEARVAALAWVRDVTAERSPPSRVVVTIAVREPVAVVRTAGQAWLVDDEAVVVAGGSAAGLVVIDAPAAVVPEPGARIHDLAVRNALAVHRALPGAVRAGVEAYDAPSDRGLRFRLSLGPSEDGVWVRFGSADEAEEKARVLMLMLDQVQTLIDRRGEPPPIAEIDVRAPRNPVLVPAGEAATETATRQRAQPAQAGWPPRQGTRVDHARALA